MQTVTYSRGYQWSGNRVDKYKSSHKRKRKGFKGIPAWQKSRITHEGETAAKQEVPPQNDEEVSGSNNAEVDLQIDQIINAVWAIFYHMILGPSYESVAAQHSYCPDGKDSWCKYKKDTFFGTNTYDRTKCLPFVFRGELKPIFDRLSSQELLKSCSKGLTQNQNESLNSVLWTKCSKRVFVGKDRFTIAVCEAITQFNDGARSTQSLFEKLKISCGLNTAKALNFTNKKRLQNSRLKVSSKYRIQRQKLRSR